MQNKFAKQAGKPDDSAVRDEDDAINARLTAHIRANTFRVPVVARKRLDRGIFRQMLALIGLIGLMVVSYVYIRLIGEEA
jgi:hypothetical protein